MQPIRRIIDSFIPTPDPAWEGVRKWKNNGEHGLSAPDKLAWHFLWQRSRQGRERIAITSAEVAEDQNVTSDAGRQRLKNLQLVGLVYVVKGPDARGVWIVELPDPERVAEALQVKWDAQRVLGFEAQQSQDAAASSGIDHATESVIAGQPRLLSTEEPTEDPRSSLLSSRTSNYIPSSTFSGSSSSSRKGQDISLVDEDRRRGTSGGSSAQRNALPPLRVGQAKQLEAGPEQQIGNLGIRRRIPTPEQQEAAVLAYEELIVNRVKCPNMDPRSARKIAREVYSGKIRKESVDDLLDNLGAVRKAGLLNCPASAYFHQGMKRIRSRAQSGEPD